MTQSQAIEANNNQIEALLKSNTQDPATIKSLIKKNKLLVYSVDDLSRESQQFLIQASTISDNNRKIRVTQPFSSPDQ